MRDGDGGDPGREGDRTATYCVGPPGTEGHTLGHTNRHTHSALNAHTHTQAHASAHRPTDPRWHRRGQPLFLFLSLSPSLSLSYLISLRTGQSSVQLESHCTSVPHRASITFIPSIGDTSTC